MFSRRGSRSTSLVSGEAGPSPSYSVISLSSSTIPNDNSTLTTVRIDCFDKFGAPVVGYTPILSKNSIHGTLSAIGITDSNGRATATFKSDTAESVIFTAVVAGRTLPTVTLTVNSSGGGVAPTVSSVDIATGNIAGGRSIKIYGSNFTGTVGAAGVKFGSANATSYTVDTDGQITVTVPAHTYGTVNIIVTNGTGPGTLTNGFKFVNEPDTLSSVIGTIGNPFDAKPPANPTYDSYGFSLFHDTDFPFLSIQSDVTAPVSPSNVLRVKYPYRGMPGVGTNGSFTVNAGHGYGWYGGIVGIANGVRVYNGNTLIGTFTATGVADLDAGHGVYRTVLFTGDATGADNSSYCGGEYWDAFTAGHNFSSGGNKTELYLRAEIKLSAGWTNSGNTGTKLVFFSQVEGNNHYIGLSESDGDDFWPRLQLQATSFYLAQASQHFSVNAWHELEVYFKANTPGTANGICKMWIDGILVIDVSDVPYFASGKTAHFDGFWMDCTYGGGYHWPTSDIWFDIDHWYASAA